MAKTYKQKYMKQHPNADFNKEVLSLFCPDDIPTLKIPKAVASNFCRLFHNDCVACWNQTDWRETLKNGGNSNVYTFPKFTGSDKS